MYATAYEIFLIISDAQTASRRQGELHY